MRKSEHRSLRAAGDDTLAVPSTSGSTPRRTCRRNTARASPRSSTLKTARAGPSRKACAGCGTTAARRGQAPLAAVVLLGHPFARLAPVIETARLIHRHLPNILTYFMHPITNAVSEGLNSSACAKEQMRASQPQHRQQTRQCTAREVHQTALRGPQGPTTYPQQRLRYCRRLHRHQHHP